MFVGRDNELRYLEDLYSQSNQLTCSVLGLRGVGKSRLISEFCRDKRSLIIEFIEGSRVELLSLLKMYIEDFLGNEVPPCETLVEYFRKIADLCRRERTVVVLDEFPYLLDTIPESSSIVQWFIDTALKGTDTMVIICGSQPSVIEKETNDPSRPLYGRADNRLTVRPLKITDTIAFHERMSDLDQIRTYLTVGGIPRQQRKFDGGDYRSVVVKRYISDSRDMEELGPSFVRELMKNAELPISILSMMASGSVRLNEIADRLGVDRSNCSKVMKNMEEAGIIGRVNPMFDSPKRPVYAIENHIPAFHYLIVNKVRPLMTSQRKDLSDLDHRIDTYMGQRFEFLCRDYVLSHYSVKEIGKWWGRVDGEDVDIDIAATVTVEGIERDLFCECKFTKRPMGFGTLNVLRDRVGHVKGARNVMYMLMSANGFEDDLTEYAEEEGVILVDGRTILRG